MGLIDEAIVKGDAAKNAIEQHLVLGRERGIELRSVKVIHGLKLEREINSPVEGAFMLDEGFHNLNVGAAQDNV